MVIFGMTYDTYIYIYIHTDSCDVHHVSVGFAQDCPNKCLYLKFGAVILESVVVVSVVVVVALVTCCKCKFCCCVFELTLLCSK